MKRIKTVGITAVMALILTAMLGVAAASASQFRAEEYPTTIRGQQVKTAIPTFGTNAGTIKCSSGTLSGTESAASSSVSVDPTYSGCKAFGFAGSTVSVNSCHYAFNSLTEAAPYTASMAIVCAKEGDAIEVNSPGCQVRIPAQSNLGTVSLENSGSSSNRVITVTTNVTGLKYTVLSSCIYQAGTFEDGTYTGSTTFEGLDGEDPVGVYVANEQVADPRLFEAESYPAALSGVSKESLVFTSNFGTLKCSTASLAGELGGASANLTITPLMAGCQYAGTTMTVNAHSCSLTLGLSNGGSPYPAAAGVSCGNVGDAITISGSGCEIRIGAQSGLGSVQLENTGTGTGRGIHVSAAVTGLAYTLASCGGSGAYANGTVTGSWQLSGAGQGVWVE